MVLAILCIAISVLAVTVSAEDDSSQWNWETYGSGVVLTEYLGSKADVYVPSTITSNGTTYNVIKLGDSIFENNDAINSVTFGKGILEIGDRAFYDCDKLVCALVSEELTKIGNEAFAGCDIR